MVECARRTGSARPRGRSHRSLERESTRIGRQQAAHRVEPVAHLGVQARVGVEATPRERALRPEALHTARGRAPGGTHPHRESPVPFAGREAERGAHAPFLVVALLVGQETPGAYFHREALQTRPAQAASEFQAAPRLRVAPVVAKPYFEGGRQHAAFKLHLARTLERQAQAPRARIRRGESRHRFRFGPHEEDVGLDRKVVARDG